jgi:uncharacterized membrane protein
VTPLPKASPFVEWAYRLFLFGQGLLGTCQFIGGLALTLAPTGSIPKLVDWMVRAELAQDLNDPVARTLFNWAAALGPSADGVYAIYLLGHGILNIFVVTTLFFRVKWAYHFAMIVLSSFVAFQLFEFAVQRDPLLLPLTIIDLLVIALVWLERRQTREAEYIRLAPQPSGKTE